MKLSFTRAAAGLALMSAPLAGALPAQPSDPRPASGRASGQDGYSLAFVEADVRRVVDAVLGAMLEADYSVDPAVQGNITLRTRQPVPRESLLPLLESALRSVDAVIYREGAAYRVVPREQARVRAPVAPGDGSDQAPVAGYASEIVPLLNGSAAEVARLVEQFLGEEVVVGVDAARNQLMIAGTTEERQAARTLIERFDVDTLAGMNFQLVRLENVDAGTIADELERIFQPPFDLIGTRVRLVPLPRLRALLVIGLNPADIERIEPWIRRLDAGVSGRRRLHSYAVQNGRARDIARSLQLVLGAAVAPEAPAPPAAPPPRLGAENERMPIAGIDREIPRPAPEPAPELSPSGAQSGAGPRIVPNDENNSLLIYADGEEFEFIREALERLDQPVAQVLIEATLAEVTLTDDLRYGVNFAGSSGDFTFGNSSTSSGTPAPIFPGFSVSVIGSTAQAVLNTLQSRTHVRVLSAPKLMVLNNQPATLQVGDQVPIVIQQAQSVGAPGAPLVNTIELRDTGVILNVTPRVNDSGTIILDISQEVSEVVETTTSGINSPTIQQRRITSTVATRSGQMIALGGLIRESTTRRRSGIPGLSQIPIIGGLFGTHGTNGGRTELIILLTPTVIRSPQDVGAVVDAVIDGLERTRPLLDRAREGQVSGRLPQQ